MIRPVPALHSPQFSVDDEPDHDLSSNCLGVVVEEGVDELPRMHAEFIASAADATQAPTLEIDKRIRVILGTASRQRVIFAGLVAAIAYVFDEGASPRIVVSAERASRSQRRRSDTSLRLVHGNDLLSARVMVARSPALFTAAGETVGWPAMSIGRNLRIEGVGASFSGGYYVTRFTHTFDAENGLRSTFEARRAD